MSDVASFAKEQLKQIIERIEAVEGRIRDENADKSEIYQEAKANGFDVKALKKIVALRRQDADERKEAEAILDLYMQALGMTTESE